MDSTEESTGRGVTARPTHPDGKGVSGVMLDLYASTPRGVVAKPRGQLLAEYFTSMLVLSATFKYRPPVGAESYLYFIDGEWTLSLIAPDQWSDRHREGFAGTCVLQSDRTWTIQPSPRLAEQETVAAAIARFYEAFAHFMGTDQALEDILPFGAATMPYYQRIGANALSRSIRDSAALGGQLGQPAREWVERLPEMDRLLLGGPR